MENLLFSAMPDSVKELLYRFDRAGYEAYAVGGCVRDVLMERTVHDWDLCSSASPQQVAELFSDCKVLPTGEAHGTVTLLWQGAPYEITMFRHESDYDGRKPASVRPARTIEEDLARRDFTVNAMAYHPQRGLLDCYEGKKDLKQGLLRAVGEPKQRFAEDYLRILRGLRFSACYGLSLEEKTAEAMVDCAAGLALLSGERVWQELSRLLMGEKAGAVLEQYGDILQGLGQGWEDFSMSAEDGQLLDKLPGLCGRLALILTPQSLEDLRCPRDVKQRVNLIWAQMPSEEKGCPWLAKFPKQYRREDMEAALLLAHREDELGEYRAVLGKNIPLEVADLAIKGQRLLEMGLPKGPKMGKILHHLLQEIWVDKLENNAADLEKAAAVLIQKYTNKGE